MLLINQGLSPRLSPNAEPHFLWVSDALASGGVVAALADVTASVTPSRFVVWLRPAVVVGVVGIIALVNMGGVRRGARLVGITTAAKLVPLLIFVVVGASAIHGANFSLPSGLGSVTPGRAVLLALFALTGMENALCASGEVAEPARTIPRALALALISVTVLYVAIQFVCQGILGPTLATSSVPLADAMGRISPALRVLMLAGAGLSMLGYLGSDILSTPPHAVRLLP